MSMVTSCPACATTFRVTQEQLKHRQGKVRCGKCRSVFDAFKSLATLPDEALPADDASGVGGEATAIAEARSARQESLDIGGIDADASAVAARRQGPEPSSRGRVFWLSAVAVLAGLLAVQLGYALRNPISAAVPALRPMFEGLCAVSGCTVAPPKRSDHLAIESSDLQVDPSRPRVIVLTAALRNRGNSIVAHPAIELTLTDAQDQALARRIFLPDDYLRDPQDAQRGMAALAEVNVRIELDTGELKPAGYRLFVFYP